VKKDNALKHKQDYAKVRLAGALGKQTYYVIEGLGDLGDSSYNDGYKRGLHAPLPFLTLETALAFIEAWNEDKNEDGENVGKLDPEDDRVLIWEVLSTGHKKAVWHFSGWHWDADEFSGLDQGKFAGHARSVYDELLAEY